MHRFRQGGSEVGLLDQAGDEVELLIGQIFLHQRRGVGADIAAEDIGREIVFTRIGWRRLG